MFSLENFYSILYSNILRPANFVYNYFYPFGATSPNELRLFKDDHDQFFGGAKPFCIAFDQEPLFDFTLGKLQIANSRIPNFNKNHNYIKILANSERSIYKAEFCRENNYFDWYYFFHGFAALDWYRDSEYLDNYRTNSFSKLFMSLNRLVEDDRNYRLYLVSRLKESNLLDKGIVSLHLNENTVTKEINYEFSKLSRHGKTIVEQQLLNQNPIIADKAHAVGWDSANYNRNSFLFNKSALWHLVSETIFYYDKQHLTEKIFKPIVHKRPFMLVGAIGNLKYLKEYGFQSFDKWIDESYDDIRNSDDRINCIVEQLEKLSTLPDQQFKKMHLEMNEVLDYNFNHFFGDFKKIIMKELITNFQNCITVWNNNTGFEQYKVNIDHCNFNSLLRI